MKNLFVTIFLIFTHSISAQSLQIEGYTFEVGNRGYLSQVDLIFSDVATGQKLGETTSDNDGFFSIDLPPLKRLTIRASKKAFKDNEIDYIVPESTSGKGFLKVEMTRAPGYLFEITLADKKDSIDHIVDAVIGATIEVYNNTTEKEELVLQDYPEREFKFNMVKGNHYTILVRKKGYIAKQMEAFVNVKGCILCFEGVSSVRPGISDNLTSGNEYGTLIANVGLEKVYSGQTIEIDDLLYDINKWDLKSEAMAELDKVVNLLKYNPNLTLELGSHTDTRGKDDYNKSLSEKRAQSAVKYITGKGFIPSIRIIANGYGEDYPKNECINGVKCSQEKHAVNRRTEIKITGIDEKWVFKPLINIKREEKMENDFFNNDNEVISEEELKKVLANQKAQNDNVDSAKEKSQNNYSETSATVKIVDESNNNSLDDIKYKIVVHYTTFPLPKSNLLFEKFPNIQEYKTKKRNTLYLVDLYGTEAEANTALKDKYLNDYPNAYIVKFKDGEKVD